MAKLSGLTTNSDGQEAANAINRAAGNPANAGVFQPFSGGGHGQGWRILQNGHEVAKGSVPLTAHGDRNLQRALTDLIHAVTTHHIAD